MCALSYLHSFILYEPLDGHTSSFALLSRCCFAGDPDDMGAPISIRDISAVVFPASATTPTSVATQLVFDVDVAEHLFLSAAAIEDGTLPVTNSDILNPLMWWKREDCTVPTGVSSGVATHFCSYNNASTCVMQLHS